MGRDGFNVSGNPGARGGVESGDRQNYGRGQGHAVTVNPNFKQWNSTSGVRVPVLERSQYFNMLSLGPKLWGVYQLVINFML
jgi:hypothetical protein